ncbi:HAMP domain-containing protein [bacterium]|nr:HAMP domain-containing protein [bacterium]
MESKTKEEGISIARDVAARATDLIIINDLYSLQRLLLETKENYPDVSYVFIEDNEQVILAHTFGSGFPTDLIGINPVESDTYQNTITLGAHDEIIWDIAVPIFNGKAGIARIGISNNNLVNTVSEISTKLLVTFFLVLCGSLLAASALTWVLTKPILALVDAARQIEEGDYSYRVQKWANDEIGDLAVAFNQMAGGLARLDAIRREREQLRMQLLESTMAAQEQERNRISRELHDSTSQSLTSMMVCLRMMEGEEDLTAIRGHAERLRGTVRQTLEDVHRIAVELRPVELDDQGLAAALDRHAKEYTQFCGVAVDLQVVGVEDTSLSSEVKITLYRIIQESLTNITKYANAKRVSICLEQRADQISAIVEDDGVGFDVDQTLDTVRKENKLGIYGMRERAELLGGTLMVESRPGNGTAIFARIPLEAELHE